MRPPRDCGAFAGNLFPELAGPPYNKKEQLWGVEDPELWIDHKVS
jgi:hypothetical protein